MVGTVIKSKFHYFFLVSSIFATNISNSKNSDTTLIGIQPSFTGLYALSGYHQLNSRLSNGQAGMFLGSQGRSKYQFTPNSIYSLTINFKPWRSCFYTQFGIERSNLRTKIYIEDASVSRTADYQKAIHHIKRSGMSVGIGTSIVTKGLKGKAVVLNLGISYILQLLNYNQNDYVTLNGSKITTDTGFVFVDSKGISPNLKVYHQLYNYLDRIHGLNLNFGFNKEFNPFKLYVGMDVRLSFYKIGNLYMDYYPGNQLIPGTQINEITGTGIGLKIGLSYPIVK